MRYCTWKLELVSNILWVIVGIAHIHCFVCVTHTDFQKYWICCTTMLYLAFSSVYIWIKKVVEVLAFQRDMQRYRWYHPLLSGLPWNAISNLDTLHIGRNQVASKKIRFFLVSIAEHSQYSQFHPRVDKKIYHMTFAWYRVYYLCCC